MNTFIVLCITVGMSMNIYIVLCTTVGMAMITL